MYFFISDLKDGFLSSWLGFSGTACTILLSAWPERPAADCVPTTAAVDYTALSLRLVDLILWRLCQHQNNYSRRSEPLDKHNS